MIDQSVFPLWEPQDGGASYRPQSRDEMKPKKEGE